MQSTRFAAIFLVLVMLVGILSLRVISQSMSEVLIKGNGEVTSSKVTARSGSASDVQAAVNAIIVAGGGTVYVPAGMYYWNGETVTIPGGVNVMGSGLAGCNGHPNFVNYTASTILHNNAIPPDNGPSVPVMFYVDGGNGKFSRISGIQFEATAPPDLNAENSGGGVAIHLRNCLGGARVDHCAFINFASQSVYSSRYNNGHTGATYVLIDHCVVYNIYKKTLSGSTWGYGFYVNGQITPSDNFWNDSKPQDFFGHFDDAPAGSAIMYVEDSHFSYCRHCTDTIQGGFYCVRYCLIDNEEYNAYQCGAIDMHGSGGSWISGKGCEAYNNTMIGTYANGGQNDWMLELRDGSALFYDNTFTRSPADPNSYLVVLCNDDNKGLTYTEVSSTYIWGNTFTGCSFLHLYSGNYEENVNYFLRAPNLVQDGFTCTPYPYPHPWTK